MSPLFLLVKFREDAITYLMLGQEFNPMALVVAAVSCFPFSSAVRTLERSGHCGNKFPWRVGNRVLICLPMNN